MGCFPHSKEANYVDLLLKSESNFISMVCGVFKSSLVLIFPPENKKDQRTKVVTDQKPVLCWE